MKIQSERGGSSSITEREREKEKGNRRNDPEPN
jgi:hypothetical protein